MAIMHIHKKKLLLKLRNKRVLLIAIIFSMILHALLISQFSLSLPFLTQGSPTIEMRLVAKTPASPPVAKSAPHEAEKPEDSTPAKTPIPEEMPNPSASENSNEAPPPTPTTAIDNSLTPSAAATEAATTDDQSSTPNQAESNTNATIPTDAPQSNQSEEPAYQTGDTKMEQKPNPYQYVESFFEVKRGKDTSAIATNRVIFKVDKIGSYMIDSQTHGLGLASLFINLSQKSEGGVSDRGLTPGSFIYQSGKSENDKQIARFNWREMELVLQTSKGTKREPLVAGTQDLLSFMYQFMFVAPLDQMQLTITNGKNLRTYQYVFEGEEQLETKMGTLNTIHIARYGKEEEKLELWLAPEYQNLPIKIRKTENDGELYDLTITNIVASHLAPR